MWILDDVIAAVASAPGSGRRGIVRVSGPGVQSVITQIIRGDGAQSVAPLSRATRIEAALDVQGLSTPLPAALFVWPNHRSYSGQPTIEIHTIGSPPILNAIVEDLVGHGARIARPGEFTLRAFLAGKIDLVQAEAVLGVIDADSTEQLLQALTQLAGGVSSTIRELRELLLIDLADLEAGLDFVEEDIEFVDRDAMTERLEAGVRILTRLEERARSRGQTTGRRTVVLAGLPNAGKSTLFNALVGQEAAIVSPVAGTTRDWLTATIDLGGVTIDLVDTAGAEPGLDDISEDAQRSRMERLKRADLVVWCAAADSTPDERLRDAEQRTETFSASEQFLSVATKFDCSKSPMVEAIGVSAITGAGIDELREILRRWIEELAGSRGELLSSTLARCGESLALAKDSLMRSLDFARNHAGEEVVAFELRRSLDALGEMAGVIYTEDLLDRIFSRFCIGK